MTAANGPVTVAAVLVAAGSGSRLGADVPKAFVRVAGRTLLEHAVDRFRDHPGVGEIVVVAPQAQLRAAADLAAATVVAGGATRQASVLAGLAAVTADLVLVHDVARPFVPGTVVTAVIEALTAGADAAVPVVPVHDTIRRIGPDGGFAGVVDRASLVAVQTPQGFRREVLVAAHEAGRHLEVTDDAALLEAAGRTVVAVPGADEAFKITRPWDLRVAEAIGG
ncbi:2-C-methyl-D-erythritol 4-phosphate cytidylyltransferase [Jatrophihabitans fulvus]